MFLRIRHQNTVNCSIEYGPEFPFGFLQGLHGKFTFGDVTNIGYDVRPIKFNLFQVDLNRKTGAILSPMNPFNDQTGITDLPGKLLIIHELIQGGVNIENGHG